MGDSTGVTSTNLAMIGYTGQTKVDPALAEAILNRKKEQTTNPVAKVQKPETDSFVSSLTKATSNNNGKFDIDQAAINFGKGLISPLTQMFSSPKNFAIGAGMMAGAAALTIATGGAILPFIVAIGLGTGTVQACTGLYKFATAKNGDEREKAFFDAGAATSTIAGSVAGAKPALNTYNAAANAGIKVSNNSFIAAGQCITNAKGSAGASIQIAKALGPTNLAHPFATLNTIKNNSKGVSNADSVEEIKPKIEAETKPATTEIQVKSETDPSNNANIQQSPDAAKTPEVKQNTDTSNPPPNASTSGIRSKPTPISSDDLHIQKQNQKYLIDNGIITQEGKYTNDSVKEAVSFYEGYGHRILNRYMRTGKIPDGYTKKQLDQYISNIRQVQVPLPEDVIVYRGGVEDYIPVINDGAIYKDGAFISTAMDRFNNFGGKKMEILLPKGTKIIDMTALNGYAMAEFDGREIILLPEAVVKYSESMGMFIAS